MAKQPIYIGTSGWHYEHWLGPFYPEELSSDQWLSYYAGRFHSVEINNTFYQLPDKETFTTWRERVPADFIFSVKASRYITHMKKLKDPQQPLTKFFNNVEELGDKLGPILFQLPPNWHFNEQRLAGFLDALPQGYRYVFEFRDPSWFDQRAYELLARHNAAFCIYDLNGRLSPKKITADHVYVRLHGPGPPYQGKYDIQTLSGWAGAFSAWNRQGKAIYCYFNNDVAGYAVQNAGQLQAMLAGGEDK
jgi:uncharacterized protein YecE (DUF72 family)